jgi:2-polyprenyl-6-methoxyphenol hydroxylase-like FAD-dependent oxidoreductase
MVNLQQYHLEQYLVERAQKLPAIDLRWQHKVDGCVAGRDGATVDVETPTALQLQADWLIVADGARSPIRRLMGLDIEGKVFQDRFLIADVVLKGELFPADRPSAGSGSTRPSTPARACCCTARPTTSGASTSSSAGTPTPKPRSSPSA